MLSLYIPEKVVLKDLGDFRVSLSQYNRLAVACTLGRSRLQVSAIYMMYNRHSLLELPFDMLVDL